MTWTKIGDETFVFREIRTKGAGIMGWWLCLMTYSAREALDGILHHDDIVDAWLPSLRGENEAHADYVEEVLGMREAAEAIREKGRLERDSIVGYLVRQLKSMDLLRKRRGSNSGYKLFHPNGSPYETHQPTRIQREAEKAYEREKSRQRRMAEGLSVEKQNAQALDMTTEFETTLGRVGSGQIQDEKCVAADIAEVLAPVSPDAPTAAAVEAAVESAVESSISREEALAVVRKVAATAADGAAKGTIRHPGAYVRSVVPNELYAAAGRLAEAEHLKRTKHEKRPREQLRGLKRQREREEANHIQGKSSGLGGAKTLLAALLG